MGPRVDPSKKVLSVCTVGEHGQLKALDVSTCDALSGSDLSTLVNILLGEFAMSFRLWLLFKQSKNFFRQLYTRP